MSQSLRHMSEQSIVGGLQSLFDRIKAAVIVSGLDFPLQLVYGVLDALDFVHQRVHLFVVAQCLQDGVLPFLSGRAFRGDVT